MTTLLTTAIFYRNARMSGRLDPLRSASQAFGKCRINRGVMLAGRIEPLF
ncbi:hypothetical protein [Burkholderia sp. USMB20]|nr:hypothetical protein [Burkholderia sp. USMB20]